MQLTLFLRRWLSQDMATMTLRKCKGKFNFGPSPLTAKWASLGKEKMLTLQMVGMHLTCVMPITVSGTNIIEVPILKNYYY